MSGWGDWGRSQMPDRIVLTISGSREALEEIQSSLNASLQSPSWLTERRSLDGRVAPSTLIANVELKNLPAAIRAIKAQLTGQTVSHIQVHDVEIQSPTHRDLDELQASIEAGLRERDSQ